MGRFLHIVSVLVQATLATVVVLAILGFFLNAGFSSRESDCPSAHRCSTSYQVAGLGATVIGIAVFIGVIIASREESPEPKEPKSRRETPRRQGTGMGRSRQWYFLTVLFAVLSIGIGIVGMEFVLENTYGASHPDCTNWQHCEGPDNNFMLGDLLVGALAPGIVVGIAMGIASTGDMKRQRAAAEAHEAAKRRAYYWKKAWTELSNDPDPATRALFAKVNGDIAAQQRTLTQDKRK